MKPLKNRSFTVTKYLLLTCALIGPYLVITSRNSAAAGKPQTKGIETPTGKTITPSAAPGSILQDLDPKHATAPDVRAGGPGSLAVSPDGRWLVILAGGYNRFFDASGKSTPTLDTEYIFLFDITGSRPKQIQCFPIHASFQGLAWAPSSKQFFASGGIDDTVAEFVREEGKFAVGRTFQLGHKTWNGPNPASVAPYESAQCGIFCVVEVGGLAVSPDGAWLLVANVLNDSVSLIDIATGRTLTEQDLRPGIIDPARRGEPGGSYPRAVIWTSPTRAYVASERDREIIALNISGQQCRVTRRIPVNGQPVALISNRAGSRVFVALDTANQVAIIDAQHDRLIEALDVVAPKDIFENVKKLGGANTNALALLPDERTLLVSNGGENALAVVALGEAARGATGKPRPSRPHDDDDARHVDHSEVVGLVPTGWYPSGVALSRDGGTWFVMNGKTPTGPNVGWCAQTDPTTGLCRPSASIQFDPGEYRQIVPNSALLTAVNQHVEQLEKASLLSFHAPSALELAQSTKQVAHNNGFDRPDKTAADDKLFAFLRGRIKHVIYIMKENRTYDQILGDLGEGNGDPRFTLFPERISPNHHALARNFVDLDNTLVSGEGSPQGWTWTYAAQTTDYNERNEPHFYAGRGVISDSYGNNREINTGYATSKERHAEDPASPLDPDILPGAKDVNAPDGPAGSIGTGYLWDIALQQGLTVRNYGLARSDLRIYYFIKNALVRHPYAEKRQVMWTAKASLMPNTDPYFAFQANIYPDYWRVEEWKREFADFSAKQIAPNLMVMWLGGDHTGFFKTAMDGVNTPETQVADNDYALGEIVEAVAKSPFAKDTLVVSIEDDPWDGADHVDVHRTVALFAGPYVRQRAVVSTRYSTVNVVKTIEEILGIGPIGLNDALAAPMSDIFNPQQAAWSYKAIVPDVLRSTQLPLPPDVHAHIDYPRHSAAYWANVMKGQDLLGADRGDSAIFNRALWQGLKGTTTPRPIVNDSDK